ncbi:hypothetical protein HA402_001638 [Bradysia odoriphaga]|nr:hypothetical protein HA402_001638 [Bradysia odoriphaga]
METIARANVVKIARVEGGDPIEFAVEEDDSIIGSTVKSIFPGLSGIKFRTDHSTYRAVAFVDDRYHPPVGGWTDRIYICVFSNNQQLAEPDDQSSSTMEMIVAKAIGFFIPKSCSHQKKD